MQIFFQLKRNRFVFNIEERRFHSSVRIFREDGHGTKNKCSSNRRQEDLFNTRKHQ